MMIVYLGYLLTYIVVLLNPKYNDSYLYPFKLTSTPESAYNKGVILLTIASFFFS